MKIKRLSPHVADLIAAGEVVERPGSVVKELIENSIDAAATAITVEIKNGGLTYIRVTDNGAGMSAEDAGMAFLRHATSKLRDARDLEAIGTLGFRGEALAAISAVSRIDLLTSEKGEKEGRGVSLDGGTIVENAPAGCPEGTTIIVRDLFFNTPARLKFMKTDKAEGAGVTAALLKCALSHPEVSFRYIKDGKEEYHTPGDGNAESCIYTLLGRDFAKSLLQVKGADENVTVTGFVTMPSAGRGNRGGQYFFVDGRPVKSKTLQAALEQAYKNSLFQGRFPGCVLYLDIKPGAVDVNVHPAKTEVKFLNEKGVFNGVYYSALSALRQSSEMPEIALPTDRVILSSPGKPDNSGERPGRAAGRPPVSREPSGITFPELSSALPVRDETRIPYRTKPAAPPEKPQRSEKEQTLQKEAAEFRVVGEALSTYIIVERGDSLIFIDKHAAHERIIFDKLRAEGYEAMPQLLLTPLTFELGPAYTELLMENADLLGELGFEIDRFGGGTVALRQVPGGIEVEEMDVFLSEICENLTLGKRPGLSDTRDKILHTIACKAAIKAGKASPAPEMELLIKRVLSGEVKYCPHGRPVSMELSKRSMDKNFKRV